MKIGGIDGIGGRARTAGTGRARRTASIGRIK